MDPHDQFVKDTFDEAIEEGLSFTEMTTRFYKRIADLPSANEDEDD